MKQALSKSMVLITVMLMDLLAGIEFDLFVPSFPSSFILAVLISQFFVLKNREIMNLT